MIDPDEFALADAAAERLFEEASDNRDTITPRSHTYRGQDADDADARALAIASAVLALIAELRVTRMSVVDVLTRTARRSKS